MADHRKNNKMKKIPNCYLKGVSQGKSNKVKTKKEKQEYEVKKKIGEGSYGVVYLIYSNITSMYYVQKKIDLKGLSKAEIKDTEKEVNLLKKLDHPNIIKLINGTKSKRYLELIMEYAEKGDLYNQLIKQAKSNKYFPEKIIINWLVQICSALKYLHSKHIIHRDIKPQNIFLSKKGEIKLGDFGVSKTLNNTLEKAKTFVGTAYYLPPEIIDEKKYSYEADIWSLGVSFYQLMTFKMPFDGESIPAIIKKIATGAGYKKISKKYYSEELINIVYKMMSTKPKARPKADEILKLEFIQDRIKNYLKENEYDNIMSKTIIKRYQEHYGNSDDIDDSKIDDSESNSNIITNNDIKNTNNNECDMFSFKNIKFNNIIGLNKNNNNYNNNNQTNVKDNENDKDKNKEKQKQKVFLSKILLTNEGNKSKIINKNTDNKSNNKIEKNTEQRASIDIPKIKIKIISPSKNSNPDKDKEEKNDKKSNNEKNEEIKNENKKEEKEKGKNLEITFKSNMASYSGEDEKYGFETNFKNDNAIVYENGDKEINLDNREEDVMLMTRKENEKKKDLRDEYNSQRVLNLLNSIIMGKSDNEIENENKLINHNESDIEEDEKESNEDNDDSS